MLDLDLIEAQTPRGRGATTQAADSIRIRRRRSSSLTSRVHYLL
jgi:hypothetical protein